MRKMKESGIDWIDTIPENWKVDKFKNGFSFGKGLNITKENLTLTGTKVISYGQIHSKLNKTTGIDDSLYRFVSDDYVETSPAALVSKGDIIFADTSEDYAGIGNCVHIDIDDAIFAGYHTVIAHPEENENSKYLSYLFLTDCWRSQIRSSVSGIKVFSITQKILKQLSIILPPVEEQNKITAFLDDKCARLDDIIAKQNQVIEKLNEYRLSLITEAVTKGLNKDVAMKDSGIDIIGYIPQSWELRKLKSLTKIISKGTTPSTIGKDLLESGNIKFIKAENIQNNQIISYPEFFIDDETNELLKRSQLEESDILFVIAGATIGKTAIITDAFLPANTNQAVSFIRLKDRNNSHYVWYYLQSHYVRNILNQLAVQAAQPNLSMKDMGEFYVPFPDEFERNQIADYLDKKCAAIDDSIAKRQQLIEKLTEYKKSLIFEVVTGKKEV